MTKKTQDIFIESFRHRRVSAEIGKTAKEVSQFIDSGGSSLISGGLNSDCYTPGGFGGSPNPCPPRQTIEADDLDVCGGPSTQFSIQRCSFTGKLSQSFVADAGRDTGGGTSQTECSSAGHGRGSHYYKQIGRYLVLDEITNKWAINAKARWSTGIGDSVTVDFYINCSSDLFDLDCETDQTAWTEGDYAGSITFTKTHLASGRNVDNDGKTLIFEVQPDTEWIRYELPNTDSLAENRVVELQDPTTDISGGAIDSTWYVCTVDTEVIDTTDYDNQINFRNGIVSSGSSFGSTVLPGDGWQRESQIDSGSGLYLSRASNADGMIMRNTFEAVLVDSGFPFDWYSGAEVRRLGLVPTRTTTVLIKFTWIAFGPYTNPSPDAFISLTTGHQGIWLHPPNPAEPVGGISVDNGSPKPSYTWQRFVEYSARITMSTTSATAKVWRSDEDESTATSAVKSDSYPSSGSQLRLGLREGWHSNFAQQSPAIIKWQFIEVNGIVVLDCDRVFDMEGNLTGGFDSELNPFGEGFDLGEFDLGSDQLMSTNLIRVTESRYLLPSDAEQIQNLWIDGVHAEPNLHYTFEPPRTVLLTHTQPVGTRITAEYLSLGGTP